MNPGIPRRGARSHILLLLIISPTVLIVAHPGSGIVVDNSGRVFFAHGPTIVRVDTNGQARTIVHDKTNEKFYQLHHIQRASDGGMLTASDMGNALWRFTEEGELSRYYPPPNGMRALAVGSGGDPFAVDRAGNLYVVNSAQDRFTQILRVDPEGRIRVLAGGNWGFADGSADTARFGDLHSGSMLVASDGALLLTDDRRRVRRIAPDGTVSTLAGGPELRHLDGPARDARFDGATGLALAGNGDLFVAEQAGYIRRIAPGGEVTTIAGNGKPGGRDGPALEATFDEPTGIAINPTGGVYILEPGIPRIRRIRDGQVSTIFTSGARN